MNKGNDINVGSIEEDIEILNSIVKVNKDFLSDIENQTINQKEIKALEHLLSDYTRQKQINEEHQKVNGELREKVKELEEDLYSANCIISDRLDDIPRNKLEEIIFSNIHKGQGIFKNQYMYSTNDCVYIVRKIVEELLQ